MIKVPIDKKEQKIRIWDVLDIIMATGIITVLVLMISYLFVQTEVAQANMLNATMANCAYNSTLVKQGLLAHNFSPPNTKLGAFQYLRLGYNLKECANRTLAFVNYYNKSIQHS